MVKSEERERVKRDISEDKNNRSERIISYVIIIDVGCFKV
jgi:hypothetical protein